MTVHNRDIADMFEEIADLLELENANPFRIRAYRNAALSIKDLPHELSDMLAEGIDPDSLPSIGPDLAKKIREVTKTGKMKYLERMRKKTPPALIELLKVPGLGPKRVQQLNKHLGIETLAQLKQAVDQHKIQKARGFSEKTEDTIREGIALIARSSNRHRRVDVESYVNDLVHFLESLNDINHVTVCGSYRRWAETVGDIDIVVTGRKPAKIIEEFLTYVLIAKVMASGQTRASVMLKNSLQVDVRALPAKSYGAAVHYFTGSKAHVVALRERAVKRRLKINEYGVFKGGKAIGGTTEQSVYTTVGLQYIPPELRENRGEVEGAAKHSLPQLIERRDLKGDLHTHTNATDGKNSLREMAEAAKEQGFTYIADTDHSQRMTMSHGFSPSDLKKQIHLIEKLNSELHGIIILKGVEVDILEDGRLDLPNDVLSELDVVIASIHTNFKLSREKQTHRMLKAIENPYITMVGHLTGRLIGERPGYDIDVETVLKAIQARECYIELNADPARLDIDDIHCRMAKDMGILVAINSDAHSVHSFKNLDYGVGQARRGWLEKDDVLNSRPLSEVKKLLMAPRR